MWIRAAIVTGAGITTMQRTDPQDMGRARGPRVVGRRLARALDGAGSTTAEVGGKAASLDRLVANGFPVPRAFALTSDAYRAFVAGADIEPLIDELRDVELPSAESIDAETKRVDAAFLDRSMPSELEQTIREIARELLSVAPVAVRSSATAEDLAAASFAGQYRTFLDLKTEDEVIDAVVRCWASLWGPSVRAYRRRQAVSENDLAMAVIIQAMAPAEWAGVLFTRDPDGDQTGARIEAVRGLGERLVSGRVTPFDYTMDRGRLTLLGSHSGRAPRFLEDLLRMGLRIERAMGAPQDIEWAFAGGRLFVLQARPITVHETRRDDDGFDTTPVAAATYTPAGVQEMLPGVVPPLLWTINAPMLENAFRRLFDELGVPIPPADGPFLAIGRCRGRAALNLSLLRDAAATMPARSGAEVERQYFGRVLGGEQPTTSNGSMRRAIAGIRSLRVRRGIEDEVETFAEAVRGVLALGVPASELPIHRLLAYRARIRDLAFRGYAAEIAVAAAAASAFGTLESTLARWVDYERAALWAQRLTASGGSQTRLDPPSASWASNRGTHRHLGSMSIYGGPTWDEAPTPAGSPATTTTRREGQGGEVPLEHPYDPNEARLAVLAELQAELRRSWRWRATRVLTGQVVDVRERLLRKLAADASRFLALREKAKAALLSLGGEERRLFVEASRRLEASGSVSSPEEALLVSDRELEEMLLGRDPVPAAELLRRRHAFARAQAGEPLPETFVDVPGAVELPEPAGDVLAGWAASPGRVRGSARVVRSLAEGRHLLPGEILVARTTDPSWTPLFLIAGGIVLEEGGPLSHAAIVAREFGVPAVLNVKGALRSLEGGERLEVDGSAGLVVRMREEAAA